MSVQHTLFVCTSCASIWKDGKRQGKSGGEELAEQLSRLIADWDLREEFQLQTTECMSACSHSCTVSFVAPGKYTYLFGDLPADRVQSAIAILEGASQYYAKPDGLLPWSERPEPLKKGVIARIPPLGTAP